MIFVSFVSLCFAIFFSRSLAGPWLVRLKAAATYN